jgi:hypothetical protein
MEMLRTLIGSNRFGAGRLTGLTGVSSLGCGVLRSLAGHYGLGAATAVLIAALLPTWAAPAFEQMPDEYVAEVSYTAQLQSRQTPWSAAEAFDSVVRRRDQTMTSEGGHSVIQGDAHWLTPAGAVIFETFNLYGVDRRTRQNLAGYGGQDRAGQYLFPPHTEAKQYAFWDPIYAGPYVATFDRAEEFHGVDVYAFNTSADGIDETAGYASLPDVPQKYGALTFGKGRLWVEPVSGVVVDHEDSGASYFVERATGRRVGEPMNRWHARYTPQTIDAQLRLATDTRWRMRALELWLPLAFAAAAIASIAAGIRSARGSRQ